MKIKFAKDYKNYFTLADIENAKKFEREAKAADDNNKIDFEWEIKTMINEATGFCESIIKVFDYTAEFAKNCRAWNIYENTQDMDVWLSATAKTTAGFIEVGAYLSDIWKIGAESVRQHFLIYEYRQA